jgi:hypothetical protein
MPATQHKVENLDFLYCPQHRIVNVRGWDGTAGGDLWGSQQAVCVASQVTLAVCSSQHTAVWRHPTHQPQVDVPVRLVNDDVAPGVKAGGWVHLAKCVVYACLQRRAVARARIPAPHIHETKHKQVAVSLSVRSLPPSLHLWVLHRRTVRYQALGHSIPPFIEVDVRSLGLDQARTWHTTKLPCRQLCAVSAISIDPLQPPVAAALAAHRPRVCNTTRIVVPPLQVIKVRDLPVPPGTRLPDPGLHEVVVRCGNSMGRD